MAAHSKSRRGRSRPRRSTVRVAGVLALAGAAGALGGPVQAEPQLSPAQVRARVDRLHQEAETATERYNGAREAAERAEGRIDRMRDAAARRREELNAARAELGAFAAAQYRTGGLDPAMQLALSATPDDYLTRADLLRHTGERRARQLTALGRGLRAMERLRDTADQELTRLRETREALQRDRKTVEGKLAEARRLLNTLDPDTRASVLGGDGAPAVAADRTYRRGVPAAPNRRAAAAVSYAMAQVGKPYVWGASGPNSYDCSGLTQAAWRAAGVSLPRTTFTQINAGRRVSRGELAPGDLVFFYSSVSHVGMYIGNGQMVHAPRPGAAVRTAPLDQMPYAGAVRPA
ncbi:hypothetical protein SRB5_65370 [Streptomyces sp. RB5]|uniref:NlpC/P60 domain-containing protein n=1 Tax=Streptomyces smaragdinus TaxID=2585196 RepID=A0A7K0CS92_9ACTN|nr:NlpC/P60 family protein [Streptomyces smaragdinus]MQY16339.1 hypothetical protein [Streptomyces smaragdinus]